MSEKDGGPEAATLQGSAVASKIEHGNLSDAGVNFGGTSPPISSR